VSTSPFDALGPVLAESNVSQVASDDKLTVAAPNEPEARYHTVVKGDTLSKIAKALYGDAMKYPVIFEANKPMLKDPDKILPGPGAAHPQGLITALRQHLVSITACSSRRPGRVRPGRSSSVASGLHQPARERRARWS
jgi:hypothetical protein